MTRRVIPWVLVVIIGCFAAWIWFNASRQKVRIIEVESQSISQTIVASGRVRAAAKVELASLVQGRITTLEVREGDRVKAGQVLVRLDGDEAEARLRRAEADEREAAAELAQLEADLAKRDRESVVQARTELAQLSDRLHRVEALFADGIVGIAERDEAKRNRTLAESRLESAFVQAKASSEKGGRYRVLLARLERAQAEVTLNELQLANTRVRSPAEAVVIERFAEIGQIAGIGEPLLTLAVDGPKDIVFEPDEKNVYEIEIGQLAKVSSEALPGTVYKARVETIVPAVNQQQGTVQVILSLAEPDRFLLPDMTVSVDLLVEEREDALLVPRAAVNQEKDGSFYIWAVEGGRPAAQPVKLGLQDATRVEVVEGLRAGQFVVVQPPEGLNLFKKVRVQRIDQ